MSKCECKKTHLHAFISSKLKLGLRCVDKNVPLEALSLSAQDSYFIISSFMA